MLLLLPCAAATARSLGSDVTMITNKTFVRIMDQRDKNSVWFVFFHGPNCHECDLLDLKLRRAARKGASLVHLSAVDMSAQFSGQKEATSLEAPDAERSPVDEAILTALAEFPFPFSSVRELSRRTCLPRSTVHQYRYRRFTQSLRFMVRYFRWVPPPLLTAKQKQIRVHMAIELLQVLSVQNTRQWHDIVTLDESWIYLFSEHDLMWTTPGELVVDRERHTVQSQKFMLTVVWNQIGLHVPCSMF
jgi:hypothetical protein